MTEKEKARLGLLYDANYDEELLAERRRCKEEDVKSYVSNLINFRL